MLRFSTDLSVGFSVAEPCLLQLNVVADEGLRDFAVGTGFECL